MQKVFFKMASHYFCLRSARTLITDFTLDKLTHVGYSCIKYKGWPPSNYDVILITMGRVFTYDTIPKQKMVRKGK